MNLVNIYLRLLEKRPLVTKTLTSSLLAGVADAFC